MADAPPTKLTVTDSEGKSTTADSANEYFLSLALERLDIKFRFQVPVAGYRLDFMVFIPFSNGIEIEGGYWHQRQEEERLREAIVSRILQGELFTFTEDETDTVPHCVQTIRKYLRYP